MRLTVFVIILTIFSTLPCSTALAAQPSFDEFERLADQLGGRQSSVYAIYKDPQDFLWFATDTDGVLRYDGYDYLSWTEQLISSKEKTSFSSLLMTPDTTLWAATWGNGLVGWRADKQAASQFLHAPEIDESLRDDRVQTLFHDRQQRLWVGTLNGLSYLKLSEEGLWQMHGLPAEHPLRTQRIWWLAQGPSYLWVATSQGLYRLSDDLREWRQFLLNPAEQGPNRQNEVRTVAVFDSEVWIGTDFGVFFFNQQSEFFEPVQYPEGAEDLSQVRSNVLVQDPGARETRQFWSGGWGGLYLIDRESKQYVKLGDKWNKLADTDVRSIAFDNVADMWVGTRDQGIYFGRRQQQTFASTPSLAELAELGLAQQRATNVVYYSQNNDLWLGTAEGVLRRDAATLQWQWLPFPAEDFVNQVETIFVDSHDNLWVATNSQLYHADARQPSELQRYRLLHEQLELTDQAVNAIYETGPNELLFAFWGQGIAAFDPVQQRAAWQSQDLAGLRGNQVYDIVYLEGYGHFAATRYSGVFHRPLSSREWQPFPVKQDDLQGADDFLCVYAQPPQTLWFCSVEGLWRFDAATSELEQVGIEQGLPADRVVGVQADSQGVLWLLTSQGLVRYDVKQGKTINFGVNDGLPAEVMLRQSIASDYTGQMTVGSVQGAFTFTPTELALDTEPPQVALTKLVINGEDRTENLGFNAPRVTLQPHEKSLLVQYSVMDFHDTSRNNGRYRLLGASEEWSNWSVSREISFAGLSAGDYVLQIEGRNSQGITSAQPTELAIIILRPWWQTTWALTLGIVCLILAIYLLLRLRYRSLETVNKRLDEEVQLRTHELELLNAQLRQQSQTDPLTGLLNRRGFSERFIQLQQQLQERNEPLSLALLDVDHFKQVNDRHGHDVGDRVLQKISGVLQNRLRKQDIAARWGGEEFILLLPNTDARSAQSVCEALRQAIAELTIEVQDAPLKVTVTFGVAAHNDADITLGELYKHADDALYQGKASGRDQVVVA